MEQLLLSEYLLACVHFEKDPTEENEKVIQDFLSKLSIKGYIGHKDKEVNMMTVLNSIPGDYDAVATAGQFAISKIIYGLLPYAINLNNDISLLSLSFHAIDLLYEFGLIKTILQFCKEDYERWEKMVDESLRFDGIQKMFGTLALLDSAEFDKWVDMMNELKQEFTPEMIKAISALSVEDTEAFTQIKKDLAQAAVDHANAELRDKRVQATKLEEKIQEIQDNKEEKTEEEVKEESNA